MLAIAECQSIHVLTDLPHSRASPLPHFVLHCLQERASASKRSRHAALAGKARKNGFNSDARAG
ncbi:hypothetical protein GCM10009091_40180 [Pseudomonas brenneri]|nr:hypothetical protein GCM10009091_40180 [Pseudomonas brenneri]